MIPYILFALIASTTFADTWLADGQALGSGSAGTVSELTFDNGVQLVGSSNGVAVLVGTNTFPLLKEGDVPPPDLPVFDDYSIVDQPTGAKGVAPRYDLNDALFAWHISQLESATIGMVDSWFWSPDSVTGLASLAGSTFVEDVGVRNYAPAPAWAMLFDGEDDYAQSDDILSMTGTNYTWQAWIYRTSNLGSPWSALSFGLYGCPGALGLAGYNDMWNLDAACLGISVYGYGQRGSEWIHALGVQSEGIQTFYLNGVPMGTTTDNQFIPPEYPIYFGGNRLGNFENYLGGRLDEVVIWDRALSSNEVAALYNGGAGYYLTTNDPIAAEAVAIYHMDEGSGSTLADSSTAGNDATAYEGPTWAPGLVQAPNGAAVGATNTTDSINLDFVPATVRGIVMTQAEAPLTTNAFTLAVSRDNGVTWNNIALSESAYPSSDSSYQLFAGLVSVTNQPSGTQIVFRVTQSDTAQTLCGVGGSWR
jgi:hypothetical protein